MPLGVTDNTPDSDSGISGLNPGEAARPGYTCMVVTTKAKGEMSEVIILSHLIQNGFSVSLPFGDNQRYDMIVDDGRSLERVQVKTGCLRNGGVVFRPYSMHCRTGEIKGYSPAEIDAFYVYCPANCKIYRVPVDRERKGSCVLRIDPVKTKSPDTRWAKDFEVRSTKQAPVAQ